MPVTTRLPEAVFQYSNLNFQQISTTVACNGVGEWRTLPGVGVASSQRFRRGVASVPARPGVGVASQRLCPGVRPGVAPPRPGVAPNSSARPGVASQRLTEGVASVVSQSDVRAFLLQGNVRTSVLWKQ